ncbi:MAG: hypothetical protein HY698_00120, partial [Deltaproteobacteria bacterium]|nr:hypothetical protein [Deltaproteobacteria bacterium]
MRALRLAAIAWVFVACTGTIAIDDPDNGTARPDKPVAVDGGSGSGGGDAAPRDPAPRDAAQAADAAPRDAGRTVDAATPKGTPDA